MEVDDFIKTTEIEEEYIFGDESDIKYGSTSVVIKAYNPTDDKCYGVKAIQLSDHSYENILKEVEILKKINHPNIVKMKEAFKNDEYFFIIFEWMEGGEVSCILI